MSDDGLTAEVWADSRSSLPFPGRGRTGSRLEALADLGARDLNLAKLVEPHHDAEAILEELGCPGPAPDELWAVWAAEPPAARLRASRTGDRWELTGTKAFCSGAELVTHALLTAAAEDGDRLFAVDVRSARSAGAVVVCPSDWVGPGMRRSGTRALEVHGLTARPVGGPGDYVGRPGFWHGAVGVAACWLGGARAVAGLLERTSRVRRLDPHAAAQLGAMTALLDSATAHLHAVGDTVDADPLDVHGRARRDAQSVRATVVHTAEAVLVRSARALGPAPLAFDADHAQRVADLEVFIRQHHGERDLADLGRLVCGVEEGQ